MSKKLRKILTFMASLGLLVTLSLAVAACGGDDWKIETSVNETPAGGRMLSILDGVPAPSLGQEGDVCLVGETGELYLKSEQGWTRTEYTDYSVSGNALTVRYANGTTGEYSLAQSEGACEHALGDLIPVYETKCYIPGIGLRTCTKCGETFPEIIPATGHQFAEDGKTCLICDEYHIKSLAELGEFRDSVNGGNAFEGKTVYLDCNIVFPAAATVRPRVSRVDEPVTVAWEPIGTAEYPFRGTFEGCGRSISNLTCEGKAEENAGLFGVTENATVRNLKLLKADVTVENGSAGALIGEAKGTLTVSGVTVVGSTVKAEEGHETNRDVGTLVGKMEGSGTVTVKDVTVRTEETPDASTSDAKTELTQDLIGGTAKPEVQYEGKTEFTVALADGFAERLVSDNGDTQKWYEITSAAGLAAFRDSVNGTGGMEYKTYETETVKLAADIDLNNAPWTPIGEHGKEFKGTFDGGHFAINDLKVTPTKQEGHTDRVGLSLTTEWGLFGRIGQGAVVKDLTINGVTITPWVDEESASLGEVYANVYDNFVGGAIGLAENAKEISGITVQGKIDIIGNQYLGAVVGRMNTNEKGYQDGVNTKLVGNTVRAAAGSRIQGVGYYIGGVVGWAASTDMIDNVVSGDLQLVNDYYAVYREGTTRADYFTIEGHIGGLAGLNQGNVEISGNRIEGVTIKTVWLYETSQDFKRVGALLGSYGWGQIAIKNNVMSNVVIDSPNAVFSHNGLVGYFKDREGELIMQDNTASLLWRGVGYSLEKGEEKGVWTVGDANQLRALATYVNGSTATLPAVNGTRVFGWDSVTNGNAGLVQPILGYNFAGETVVLTGNVELSGENWTPLKEFAGTFKGKTGDETITGLTIDTDDTAQYKYGFISLLTGTVSDVVFRDVDINAQNSGGVGAVAAQCTNATVSNVKVFIKEGGSIFGYQWVGGLVGYATTLTATGNEVSGSIRYAWYKAGSIAGIVHLTGNSIENNKIHDVTIWSTTGFDYMGGLIGGTSQANDGVHMNGNTFENVTLNGLEAPHAGPTVELDLTKDNGDIGALMGNVGDGPYYSSNNSGTVTVLAQAHSRIHHKGLWGRDPADLSHSNNPELTVDWNGIMVTQESYALDSADDLKLFRDWVNGGMTFAGEKVVLTGPIDLNGIDNWTPIGTEQNPFRGTLDGQGNTISDLKVLAKETASQGYGLFGKTAEATLQSFTLNNVTVDPFSKLTAQEIEGKANSFDYSYVGAVVGNFYTGRIENVKLTGNVHIQGASYTGGLAGQHYYGTITKCRVDASSDSIVETYYQYAGGIAGWMGEDGTTVSDCYTNIHVAANKIGYSCVGAVSGLAHGNDKIIDNEVNSIVSVGRDLSDQNAEDNYQVGAIAGGSAGDTFTITGNKGTVRIITNGGVYMTNQGVVGNIKDNSAPNHNRAPKSPTLDNPELIIIWDGVVRDDENKAVHIYSAQGLKWLRDEINAWKANGDQPFGSKGFAGWTAYLEADINLDNKEWEPIGHINTGDLSFQGVFDGQGHKIQNLKISNSYSKGTGFFGRVNGDAIIRDVIFENADISVSGEDVYAGVVVGRAGSDGNPSLQKITVQGTIRVSGNEYVGAVVGHMGANAETIIVKADVGSYVRGSSKVGGIAGGARAGGGECRYSNLTTNITVEATNDSAGGLVGRDLGGNAYENCTATGTLSAASGAVNACFGSAANKGTTVDHFTYTGEITSGTVTGFYYKYDADAEARFTNSTATVTHDGVTTVYKADDLGNVTTEN